MKKLSELSNSELLDLLSEVVLELKDRDSKTPEAQREQPDPPGGDHPEDPPENP